MNRREWLRIALVLIPFAVLFFILTVSSYTQKSATWDEPQHLIAGYTALKFHDYRTDPEHPPFLRMWAAWPLLMMPGIKMDLEAIDKIHPVAWVGSGQFFFCHAFLYQMNDADRLLYPARFMIVLLGLLLGVLLFSWTRELFGFWPAAVALGLYTTEPNILAHSSLVTTDFAVTCFVFGTMYFLWRATREVSWANLLGLTGFFALAHVSKFSAILLGPLVLALLAVRVYRKSAWPCKIGQVRALTSLKSRALFATGALAVLALVMWVTIWTVYGFRYLPSASSTWQFRFQDEPGAKERVPVLAGVVNWADEHRLLPNAYTQGFLLTQIKAQQRGAFLAGQFSREGWWYYFPVAFLIKTPVALIVLFLAGVALCAIRWRTLTQNELFMLLPLAAYLAATMTAKLNIGLRHILPIYPFVLLLAGKTVAECLVSKRRALACLLGALCLSQVVELARVYPHYLAFFNQFIGGPRNGNEYLVDSNLDWGQDLKPLKAWMDKNNVVHINLSYFGTADPAYYGINCTHLPGAPFFDEQLIAGPQLPGYVAVSVTNLRGVYLSEAGRAFYRPLLERTPSAVIGYSIHVYWVEREWW
jgi:hypothetical protein